MSRWSIQTIFVALAVAILPAAWASTDEVPLQVMPWVDIAQYKSDAQNNRGVLRFAAPIDAELGLDDGAWFIDDDGSSHWRLQIQSVGASSVNLGFTVFSLPEGAQLTVSSPSGEFLQGPYSNADGTLGQLWTPVVIGDTVLIDLAVAESDRDSVELVIGKVNHGYKAFWKSDAGTKSNSCNVDVACPAADPWNEQVRAVARLQLSGGVLCTGTLLNNTAQDLRPFILTADHCLIGDSRSQAAATAVAYWNYETSSCGGSPNGSLSQNQTGAVLRSSWSADDGTDFALLELGARPDASFDVHYAGWNLQGNAPSSGVGIHHPQGDEKRISVEDEQLRVTSAGDTITPGNGRYLYIADWDLGITEGGSSGSAFFNSSGQVVGNLSVGTTHSCGNEDADWYGRLVSSWTGGGASCNRLCDWLDPSEVNVLALDGRNPDGSPGAAIGSGLVCPEDSGDDCSGGGSGGSMSFVSLILVLPLLIRRRRKHS